MRPKEEWLTHDQLVFALLKGLPSAFLGIMPPEVAATKPRVVETEVFLDGLFADVVVSWPIVEFATEQGPNCGEFALIVEVKSNFETWTAGAVIRQLKGYREKVRKNRGAFTRLALFCDRPPTEAETFLFAHEKVTIISADGGRSA